MTINIAMPIAHNSVSPHYSEYYLDKSCIFQVRYYFNEESCPGFCINTSSFYSTLDQKLWDIFAFTDGFLSFQSNQLVLRLPMLLQNKSLRKYNSGKKFLYLDPKGPQLRHVLYIFSDTPGVLIEDRILKILMNSDHPSRSINRISDSGRVVSLTKYLEEDEELAQSRLNAILQKFMEGKFELFVRAGDVIGNFCKLDLTICFIDSCGSSSKQTPLEPHGYPINPSYYLYLVRSNTNNTHVNMKTIFSSSGFLHPIDHLLSTDRITASEKSTDLILDINEAHPPKPLHVTYAVQNETGLNIADMGIDIRELGNWHQSRNASNPYNTASPIEWRYYGKQDNDNENKDMCKFLSQTFENRQNLLPGGSNFDHKYEPKAPYYDRIVTCWDRYAEAINAAADAFEIPCEILATIACTETFGGKWFDNDDFKASNEANIIRMEPLSGSPGSNDKLINYKTLVGNGKNACLPIPWDGVAKVKEGNSLTWLQLANLIKDYPKQVKVSPGIMQTLVSSALEMVKWVDSIYGNNYLDGIKITYSGVDIVSDSPPKNRANLFSDWFCVSVDATGRNTNDKNSTDATLTKIKRALHSFLISASYIKMRCNTVKGKNNKMYNLVTDFDLPTICSGYNDGADYIQNASSNIVVNPTDSRKWNRLFALKYNGFNKNINDSWPGHYPKQSTRYFNRIVEHFNTDFNEANPSRPRPVLRLWVP